MVDIGKIRIKKTSYSFDINRIYNYEKKFNVIEKNPMQVFLEGLKRKEEKNEKKGTKKTEEKKGISPLFMGGAIGIILIIALGAWIMISLGNVAPEELPAEIEAAMEMRVEEGAVITYGEKYAGLHTGKITIEQQVEGYENITLTLTTYNEEPPYQVYILEEPRDRSQTTTYDDFLSSFSGILKEKGIMLNYIDINQLKTVSKGALVVVPSGRIPEAMIKDGENNIKEILERGVHIVYIGKEFTNTVDEQGNVKVADSKDLEKVGIGFGNAGGTPSGLKYLFQPQYVATGNKEYYTNWMIYGVVSVLKYDDGGGYLIMVPQTLDAGWSNKPSEAAEDIARIVLESAWVTKTSAKTYEIESTNETIVKTYFTEPFPEKKSYVKLEISAVRNNKEFGKIAYVTSEKEVEGELYITGGTALLSTSISGSSIRIKADLKETTGTTIYPYVAVVKDGLEIKKEPLSDIRISTQTESDFDVLMDINEGEHTAQILDEYGNVYAEGYVNSVPIEITIISTKDNVFEFSFKVHGNPIKLNEINVIVDSGELGEYQFNDATSVSIDLKPELGLGGELPAGDHIFEFTIGDLKKEEVYTVKSQETVFTSPLFFGTIIFVFVILGVGSYLASQKKPQYFIDVPDFPPTEFAKIKIPKKLFLDIFAKENEYHRWKNTPLTVSEIKSGLGKTFYKGRHLNTSDFNIVYILNKLKKTGMVVEELEYFMPVEWKEFGSQRYLAMFRRLRDIFVVNAVPFTKKGETKDCDSKITVIGQEMFLYVYDSERVPQIIENLIKNCNAGINIVITGNKYEKNQFMEFLTSPTDAASIIKFENEGKTISVMDIDEFEKMIKEMKG